MPEEFEDAKESPRELIFEAMLTFPRFPGGPSGAAVSVGNGNAVVTRPPSDGATPGCRRGPLYEYC